MTEPEANLAPATLEALLARLFERNLEFLTGDAVPVGVERGDGEAFEKELRSGTDVAAVEFFDPSYRAEGMLLLPGGARTRVLARFDAFHCEPFADGEEKTTYLMEGLCGALHRLFGFARTPVPDGPPGEAPRRADDAVWFTKEYRSPDEIRALLWNAGGQADFRVEFGDDAAWLLLSPELVPRLDAILQVEEHAEACARLLLERHDPDGGAVPFDPHREVEIRVKDPAGFTLGALFLPANVPGPPAFEARIDRVAVHDDWRDGLCDTYTPLRVDFLAEGEPHRLTILLDGVAPAEAKRALAESLPDLYRLLLDHIKRQFAELARLPPEIARIDGNAAPEAHGEEPSLLLSYEARILGEPFRIVVAVSRALRNALFRRLLTPGELARLESSKKNELLSLLSLNRSLLKGNFPRLARLAAKPGVQDGAGTGRRIGFRLFRPGEGEAVEFDPPEDVPYLLLYQFLLAIPPQDVTRAIQAFLGCGNPLENLSACFFAWIFAFERDGLRYGYNVAVAEFDERRFLASVPERWREAVERRLGERVIELPRFVELNTEWMRRVHELHRAGSLLFSTKAETLLEFSFFAPFQDHHCARFPELSRELDGLYASLAPDTLDAVRRRLFPTWGHAGFAEGVFGNRRLVEQVLAAIPARNRDSFESDLRRVELDLERERIDWFTLCRAKGRFLDDLGSLVRSIEGTR